MSRAMGEPGLVDVAPVLACGVWDTGGGASCGVAVVRWNGDLWEFAWGYAEPGQVVAYREESEFIGPIVYDAPPVDLDGWWLTKDGLDDLGLVAWMARVVGSATPHGAPLGDLASDGLKSQ